MAEKDDYLIDLLVDLGFVTSEQVAHAQQEAGSSGVGVVDLMLANKIIRPADVTQAKAAHFGAEVVSLANLKIEDEVIAAVPRHDLSTGSCPHADVRMPTHRKHTGDPHRGHSRAREAD